MMAEESKQASVENSDRDDQFSLKLKPEYVLNERAASLPPIRTDTEPPKDERNSRDNGGKKGRRGRNKKRPRDSRIDSAEKMCLSVIRGTACKFGDKCRFEHDIKVYLATRPEDITELDDGMCPIFAASGHCPYGAMCRLGKSHINMATGENIIEKRDSAPVTVPTLLSKEVQNQLRKKTYPFVCKRFFESSNNKGKKQDEKKQEKKEAGETNSTVKEPVLNNDDNPKAETPDAIKDEEKDTEVKEEAAANNGNNPKVDTSDAVKQEEKDTKEDTEGKEESLTINDNDNDPKVDSSNTNIEEEKDKEEAADDSSQSRPALRHMPTSSISNVSEPKTEEVAADSSSSPKASNNVNMNPLPSRTRKLIDFSNKIYIAPLTTVGNLPFRRIMKKYGADITCGEMALAQGILEGKNSEWALLKRHPDEDIFGVQIAAGYPDMYTRTMELVEKHADVDFVDLNLGCPLDLVCDKGSGAALMLRDKRLRECLIGITNTLSCPVTVKMRTGWDERKPFAHNLVPKIQSWELPGVAAIMVHGRSRLQRYSKEADWNYISSVAKSLDSSAGDTIPIIGNGDILNYTDYEEKVLSRKELSTCAMLARGALIKPWLPTEIKERRHWDISASERLDILKDFVRFGLENWGSDQKGVNNCRRYLLEWLSFLYRYVPIGLLEQSSPQQINHRPPPFMCGRNDLETLFLSNQSSDWIKISEMLLGPVPEGFQFEPKHKANSWKPQ